MNKKDVLTLLEALGDTPNKVASRLRRMGLKGQKQNGNCCPLARYLIKNGAFFAAVIPNLKHGRVYFDSENVTLPDACNEFAKRFDEGKYPSLVA